jgi:hypothetical protein
VLQGCNRPTNSTSSTHRRSAGPLIPHRDSHVLVKKADNSHPVPCSIQKIFAHTHPIPGTREPVIEIHLVVREYQELQPEHAELDYWRRYPISGGKLYYDALQKQVQIVNVKNVVGHFAKTTFKPGELGIDRQCAHVLPLFWVCDHYNW